MEGMQNGGPDSHHFDEKQIQIINSGEHGMVKNTICAAYIGIGGMKIENEPRH